jgi:hypothetical protein
LGIGVRQKEDVTRLVAALGLELPLKCALELGGLLALPVLIVLLSALLPLLPCFSRNAGRAGTGTN